jgi:hypothetical protein
MCAQTTGADGVTRDALVEVEGESDSDTMLDRVDDG